MSQHTPAIPTIFDPVFDRYQRQLNELLDYALTVVPHQSRGAMRHRILIESLVVLTVAIYEDFLKSLLAFTCVKKEDAVRTYVVGLRGLPADSTVPVDRPTLVRMLRARVSFKKEARSLSRLFEAIFETSLWPSDSERERIRDLVLARQVIVHEGGIPSSETAAQFLVKDVLDYRDYNGLIAYRPLKQSALFDLWAESLRALVNQAKQLHRSMGQDPTWRTL